MSPEKKTEPDVKVVSRRLATVVNLIHQYVTVGLAIVQGIVLVPLYLRHIDSALYGAWLATGSIVMWLLLADAGLTNIVRQKTAQAYGAKEFDLMGKVIGTGLVCIAAVGFIPFFLSFGVAPFLPKLFGLSGQAGGSLSDSFILAGFSCSLTIIAGGAGAVQQGLQRNVTYSIIYITGAVTGIVVTVVMLLNGYGLVSIPAGLVARGIVWSILYWADIFYYCLYRLSIRFSLARENLRDMAGLTSWTFFDRLSYQLFAQCDALVVGIFLGPNVTIIYVLTRRSWDVLKMILERISVAFMPGLAHLYGEGDATKFRNISQRLMRVTVYCLVIGTGTCVALNKTFVNLWVGAEFYAGAAFDFLMTGALATIIFVVVVHHVLYAGGNIKSLSAIGVLLSSVRAAILVGLVWLMGYLGSPASLLAGFGIASALYYGPQWVKKLRLSAVEFRCELFSFARAFLAAMGLAFLIRTYVVRESWVWFIVCGLAYILVTGGALLVMDEKIRAEAGRFFAKARGLYLRTG